jgi:hypothetical protein
VDQIIPIVDLAGGQVLEPSPRGIAEMQGKLRMMTSSLVAPPSWQAKR